MKGIICLWGGAIVDIPDGWALCDGNNGTPNLTDRFVLGAGFNYAPDDTGGSDSHDHTFSGTPHGHPLAAGANIPDSAPAGVWANGVSPTAATGTVHSKTTLPKYYALAYIIKL